MTEAQQAIDILRDIIDGYTSGMDREEAEFIQAVIINLSERPEPTEEEVERAAEAMRIICPLVKQSPNPDGHYLVSPLLGIELSKILARAALKAARG